MIFHLMQTKNPSANILHDLAPLYLTDTSILPFLLPNRLGMFLPQGLYICFFLCLDNCSFDAYMAGSLSSSGLSSLKSPSPREVSPSHLAYNFTAAPTAGHVRSLFPALLFSEMLCLTVLFLSSWQSLPTPVERKLHEVRNLCFVRYCVFSV